MKVKDQCNMLTEKENSR